WRTDGRGDTPVDGPHVHVWPLRGRDGGLPAGPGRHPGLAAPRTAARPRAGRGGRGVPAPPASGLLGTRRRRRGCRGHRRLLDPDPAAVGRPHRRGSEQPVRCPGVARPDVQPHQDPGALPGGRGMILVALAVLMALFPGGLVVADLSGILERGNDASYGAEQVVSCVTPDGVANAILTIEQSGGQMLVGSDALGATSLALGP